MGVSRVTRVSVFVDRFASWFRKFFLFGARLVITNCVVLYDREFELLPASSTSNIVEHSGRF